MKYYPFLFCLLLIYSCKQDRKGSILSPSENNNKTTQKSIAGKTMGTTYSIKYLSNNSRKVNKQTIDSILVSINDAVSTYIPTSTISQLNIAGTEGITLQPNAYPGQHFIVNYFASVDIYKATEGLYDPSVMPLVNYWGFGYEGKEPVTAVDKSKVKAMLEYVGLDNFETAVTREHIQFTKKDARATLDFSAIAKGYAVDYIARFLDAESVDAYMVEIGGEVKVKGKNNKDQFWKLGINTPEIEARYNDIELIVSPKNKGLASSGNYRIYHKIEDITYGHEINPKTGFPHTTDILSASVIHNGCMYADAYATAFMIMGLERTLEFVNYNHDLEVCLIVKDEGNLKNVYSEGFKQYVVD